MKYVVVRKAGLESAILMRDLVYHAEGVDRHQVQVVSAGFVEWTKAGDMRVFGRSEILGVESRPEDARVVAEAVAELQREAK